MKKAFLFALILMGFFYSADASAGEASKLVASNFSDRYHLSTCKIAQKIRPEDIVVYATPEEAIAAGLNPCKKCNPPSKSGGVSRKTALPVNQRRAITEGDA